MCTKEEELNLTTHFNSKVTRNLNKLVGRNGQMLSEWCKMDGFSTNYINNIFFVQCMFHIANYV